MNIKTFAILDTIRERNDVMDKDWAKASGLKHGSRISELRAKANGTREVVDRSFHYKKWIALLKGLESILGGESVKKELAELLESSSNLDEKNLLLLTAVPEDRKMDLFNYLQLLVQAPAKKTKK
jgi:hypothetical protein